MQRSLLVGCGNSRRKKVGFDVEWAGELTTMDMNPNCGADIVWDLDDRPFPFEGDTFDEIGAYDVLEHIGRQGDWRGWFDEMEEYHRILKPNGLFGIIVPINSDAYADPGHTRFFSLNWFAMLKQDFYQQMIDSDQPVTDYRWYYKKNFEIVFADTSDHHLAVILRKA